MAYKFKRWKIKWNQKDRKFKKIKRDRTRSRKAHLRWVRNKGKMRQALRKSRIKAKKTRRINKSKGIYRKLKIARKRWKNILKSDRSLDMFMNGLLLSEEEIYEKYEPPEVELDVADIHAIKIELKKIRDDIELEDRDDKKVFNDWMDSAIEILEELESEDDEISRSHEDFLEEVIAFIEQYAEEIGIMDDENEMEEE